MIDLPGPAQAGKSSVDKNLKSGMNKIGDETLQLMQGLIKLSYKGYIKYTDQLVRVEEGLELAHKCGFDQLFSLCDEHLATTIDNDNLSRRLKLAKKFPGAKKLKAQALQYLKTHFDDAIGAVYDDIL